MPHQPPGAGAQAGERHHDRAGRPARGAEGGRAHTEASEGTCHGDGDKESKAKLRPLGERVAKAGGAPQWVRGRSLAATLIAWLETK